MSKYILTILLLCSFFKGYSTRINATVSGGNINNLTNAQSAYSLLPGDTLAIPITLTGYCGLGGMVGTRAQPIVVVVNGAVTPFQFEAGANQFVKFYLKLADSSCGMLVTGAGRGFVANGPKIQNCYFGGIAIISPSDYPVFFYHSRTMSGNLDSTNHNIIFDSIRISGGADLIDGFNFNNNGTAYNRGYWDSITFRNISAISMRGGNVWSVQHFFHGLWSRVSTRNTGTTDTRHSAVINIGSGSGHVDLCYFYNAYGDKIRAKAGLALVTAKGQPVDTMLVTNCIFVLSPKYGGLEINSDPADFDSSYSFLSPCAYMLANCNIGRFNDSDYIDAATVLDIYVHYKPIYLYNIIVWDMNNTSGGASPFIHIGDGSSSVTDSAQCRYGTAAQVLGLYLQDTVQAITKLNSFANRIGKRLGSSVPNSFNGQNREYAILNDVGGFQWTGRPIFTFTRGFLKTKSVNAEPDDFTKKLRIEIAVWEYLIKLQYGENTVTDTMPRRLGF